MDICRLLRPDFFMKRHYRVISQLAPPSCNTAKHLLLGTEMSGALLPPKLNQCARLRYQIRLQAALLCGAADQCSPLSNPYFIAALELIS